MIDISIIPLIFFSLFEPSESDMRTIWVETTFEKTAYRVEVADNALEHLRGLMGRTSLEEHSGMLFLYERETQAKFWMKNVAIPLDILFIDRCGVIFEIHKDARPHAETIITSSQPVMAVLEVPSGVSQRDRVRIGDKVSFSRSLDAMRLCQR